MTHDARSARLLRAYKLACFPITEELRIGLIDRHTAFVRMRQAYVDVYGEPHKPHKPAVAAVVVDKTGMPLNVTPFAMGQQIIAERASANDDTTIKEQE
jgi:hypothetical protein